MSFKKQINSGTYDAFGLGIKTGDDTIIYFFRQGVTHASDKGKIVKQAYTVSTDSWGERTDVYEDPLYDSRNVSGGLIGSRIYLFFGLLNQATGIGVSRGYIKSSDLTGESWSGYTAVDYSSSGVYGALTPTDDPDTFLQPMYAKYMLKTTDGGNTWNSGTPVYSGAEQWTECCICYIGDGKLIALCRDDEGGFVGQAVSSDNGDTWSEIQPTSLGLLTGVKVPWILYDSASNQVIALYVDRGDSQSVKVATGNADEVYASPLMWISPTTVWTTPVANPGYPSIAQISCDSYLFLWAGSAYPYTDVDTYGGVWENEYRISSQTLQPGDKDTQLWSSAPNNNYGSAGNLQLMDAVNYGRRSIIEFELPELSEDETLLGATLCLYYYTRSGNDPTGKSIRVYKLTRTDWLELEATWNVYKAGNAWSSPGGDYVTVNPAGGSQVMPASYSWINTDVMDIVENAYSLEIPAEFLIKFLQENLGVDDYSSVYFRSRDHYPYEPEICPKLILKIGSPPEEPTDIETYEASDIQAFLAQGNGFMLDATDITECGFEWGEDEGGPYPNEIIDDSGTYYAGLFGMTMTGLSALTHYYYRAKIYNTTYGWLYGNEMDFWTTRATPRVRTDPPDNAELDNIDAVGYIVSIGAENCDTRGFVYGLAAHSQPDEDTAPEDSSYDGFVLEEGDFGVGSFTLNIPNLQAGRIYHVRAWAHNSYGYHYGGDVLVLTNPDVNILYPTSDYSKGIRNDSGPGGHWPHRLAEYEERTPHYLLMRSKDCIGGPGTFGSIIGGGYIYERNDYNEELYTDLFGLANPYRRDEGILKVKWKANIMSNTYGFGDIYRKLVTHSTTYTGTDLSPAWPDGSYECEIFYDNPFSSAAWELSEVDALIAGIELGHGGGWGTPACDWLCCFVLWANAAVRTDTATKIAADSLRFQGYVLQDEAEECEVYFEYGLTTGYGSETTAQTKRITQYFTADVSGLDPLETYHYRAVIVTECGETFYGEDAAFNMYRPDRIYAWLGDSAEDELIELTDPDYPMVLYARTERGWDEELAQASAGIAELTCDNYYGDFNPENSGGQYYGDLVLGKWLTVYEYYKGIKYSHFTGKINKILPNDDPNDPTAYIMAVDGMDDIAATKVSTVLRQDTDVGELADDALDACNWDAGKRDIDTGVDTLEFGWFHKKPGLDAFRDLETTEKGRFFVKRNGDARFENRHYRITGDGLVSQATFDNTAIRIQYEWSKRLLYNDVQVTGRRYTAGGIQLFSGYDMATIESALIWSAHTGDAAAPYIPQASTVILWAEFNSPLSSYDTLVKGTHWNANTSPDKTGDDVSDNITINVTQLGQALKLEIVNAGSMGAYIVEPDSPPDADTEDKTLLIYGVLFGSENMTVIEEDGDSQDNYGKRTLPVDAPFKSKPNDILAYAQWLLARYYLPIPNPVQVAHIARTNWPDDTLRIQCLVREISERITVASTKLGFDRDFYINKVIQEYAMNQGGMVHETTWIIEQAEGSAEGLYWLLGVAGFGELGEATKLGF